MWVGVCKVYTEQFFWLVGFADSNYNAEIWFERRTCGEIGWFVQGNDPFGAPEKSRNGNARPSLIRWPSLSYHAILPNLSILDRSASTVT